MLENIKIIATHSGYIQRTIQEYLEKSNLGDVYAVKMTPNAHNMQERTMYTSTKDAKFCIMIEMEVKNNFITIKSSNWGGVGFHKIRRKVNTVKSFLHEGAADEVIDAVFGQIVKSNDSFVEVNQKEASDVAAIEKAVDDVLGLSFNCVKLHGKKDMGGLSVINAKNHEKQRFDVYAASDGTAVIMMQASKVTVDQAAAIAKILYA